MKRKKSTNNLKCIILQRLHAEALSKCKMKKTDSCHEEMHRVNAKLRMIILVYQIGSEENTL